jgi:hypothetical protein
MVPTLNLELFDNLPPSQSSSTLTKSSHNLNDITQHTKISHSHGKVGPARAIFKTAKCIGMEQAQFARQI